MFASSLVVNNMFRVRKAVCSIPRISFLVISCWLTFWMNEILLIIVLAGPELFATKLWQISRIPVNIPLLMRRCDIHWIEASTSTLSSNGMHFSFETNLLIYPKDSLTLETTYLLVWPQQLISEYKQLTKQFPVFVPIYVAPTLD